MKKILFMTAALVCAALSSCNKEESNSPVQPDAGQSIKLDISVTDPGTQTRAIKQGWEAGDKLNVWFKLDQQQEPDVVLTYNGSSWKAGAVRGGLTAAELSEAKGKWAYCYYEGFNDLSKYSYGLASEGTFSNTTTLGGTAYSQMPMIIMGNSEYTFDSSTNTLSTSLGEDGWIYMGDAQVVVAGLDNTNPGKYTLTCPQLYSLNSFNLSGNGNYDYNFHTMAGVSNEDGVAFYFLTSTSKKTDYEFTLTDYTDESNPVVKTYVVTGKALDSDYCEKCVGVKIAAGKFSPTTGTATARLDGTNEVSVDWVQLWTGGPKWATINVGVTSTSATGTDLYGGLYCWGETTDKDAEGYGDEGNSQLDETNDTATLLWGNNWRMPTKAEFSSLLDECTCTLVSGGLQVTGKGDYSGNTVFFPAAGYYVTKLYYVGESGFYWSSSPEDSEDAYRLGFSEGDKFVDESARCIGHSVRAVLK